MLLKMRILILNRENRGFRIGTKYWEENHTRFRWCILVYWTMRIILYGVIIVCMVFNWKLNQFWYSSSHSCIVIKVVSYKYTHTQSKSWERERKKPNSFIMFEQMPLIRTMCVLGAQNNVQKYTIKAKDVKSHE